MSKHLPPQEKPLTRAQTLLTELKVTINLLREVLLEIKDLLVIATLILFFLIGVFEALTHYN